MKFRIAFASILLMSSLSVLAEDSTKQMCAFISDQAVDVANMRESGWIKEDLEKKIPTDDPQFYALMRNIIGDVFISYKDLSPKMIGLDVYHLCMQRNNR